MVIERYSKSKSPAKAFFAGEILAQNLTPFPFIAPAEAETVRMVLESVDRFMETKDHDYRAYDVEGKQPNEYIEALKELGLFSLIIPEQYGGLGLSNSAYSRVVQQTSRFDPSTSLTIGAHSSIGMKGLLLFGNESQKARYLPKLASGEMIAAFCLTEAGSGSDAASIKTKAERQADGSWVLNGEKIWITNGGIADFFTVFARTDSEKGRISAFIVERNFAGVSNGPKEDKMGIRASITTTVRFDNVRVPAECLLGEDGDGFRVAMAILNNGRTGLGGGCVGGIKRCIALAAKQASERKQFGRAIAEYDLIKEKIAQMTVDCYATESVVSVVGSYIDSGVEDFSVEAAISKIFASEAMWNAAFESLQIAGGNGFMREYPYERITRDCRINLIFEGTNEILRLFIALSGAKEAGRYLNGIQRAVGRSLRDPFAASAAIADYVKRKVAQYVPSFGPSLGNLPEPLRVHARGLEDLVPQLARFTEQALRRHGKNIVNEQLLVKRLANTAIDLFVGFCVISRVAQAIQKDGERACADELRIVEIFTEQARRRIRGNLRRVYHNEDRSLRALAESISAQGGYRWDTV